MSRGDFVTVALSGDYGKPRPALIIQADAFAALPSVTVLPLTSELHDWPLFRVTVEAEPHNGLEKRSQIMVDKAVTVPRMKIGRRIGSADAATLCAVDAVLAKFLGLE
ncbi:MAG TPA: type II toxin-antitoxin system PemK/MazF family toxin [Stellaceae bacterium]|nr:type II toxin-antitoxin system PemK/MazF family toxin [Stellaceae bacterium]